MNGVRVLNEIMRNRALLSDAYHNDDKRRIMQVPTHVWEKHDALFVFAWDMLQQGYILRTPSQFRLIGDYRAEIKVIGMAKNKSTGKAQSIGEWNGITNVSFGKQDVGDMQKWAATVDTQALFADLVASDYKASFSWDNRSDVFMCSLSCYHDTDPNYKFTMVSRAPDIDQALLVALYKHYVLCNAVWGGKSKDDGWG